MPRTPKGRALGNALRKARIEKGWTLRTFARHIGRDPGVISRWETGDRTPQPESVAQLLTALGITGEKYEEIIALAYGADDPSWVATTLPAQRQQLAALLDFEQHAATVVDVDPLLIPGLLQTEDYIRAIMRGLPSGEVATRVAIRLGRKQILKRHNPVQFITFIGEAALRQVIGSRAILLDQLRHLLEMARLPNINLHVVPFDTDWHPGLEGHCMLFESNHYSPIVHVETRKSGLFFHENTDVRDYRRGFDLVRNESLGQDESMRFVASLAKRMETRK